jgi:GNAT superfamily N-acetyltransferase
MSSSATAQSTRTVAGASTPGVRLRLLEPGESAVVLAVFASMSPRSRELRFLSARPRLSDRDLRMLTAVDHRDHVAVVASVPPEHLPIGIGRFVRDQHEPETAEVALAVVDAWQRKGVGTLLMRTLCGRAAEVGVRRLRVVISPDNDVVRHMLTRTPAPVPLVHSDGWTMEYTLALEDVPRPGAHRALSTMRQHQ